MPTNTSTAGPRGRARNRILVCLVAAVIAASAVIAHQALRVDASGAAAYRTAVAEKAAVAEALTETGTLTPVAQAAVSFPISGTVTRVSVALGDRVKTGAALATLDTTSLQTQLDQKRAALATAKLKLHNDQASADKADTATSDTTSGNVPQSAPAETSRQAVDPAQNDVNTAPATAKAQADLTAARSSPTTSSRSTTAASSAAATASQETPTSTVSPEQLVADQSAVDAADAEVAVAEQNLAETTIVSPIPGTIAAINLEPGQQVSAGSTSANVVVVGDGGYEVSTSVPVTAIAKVKVGDSARVVPDGSTAAIESKVVALGVAPVSSSSITSYPVFIGLNGSPDVRDGTTATVSIQGARADAVVTVTTSAVRAVAGSRVVTVLADGKTTVTPVQVGTLGPERTEITSGVRAGQRVVLADARQALPASNTTSRSGGSGLGVGSFTGSSRFEWGLGSTTE